MCIVLELTDVNTTSCSLSLYHHPPWNLLALLCATPRSYVLKGMALS